MNKYTEKVIETFFYIYVIKHFFNNIIKNYN